MRSNYKLSQPKLEDQIDAVWEQYSLDAPRMPNPIPGHTQSLRRICIVIHMILPLIKIIFGARYVQDCPTNDWLPRYMLIGGFLQICFVIILIYKPFREPFVLTAVGLAVFIWMIIASINIFVEWKPDFFLGGWRYCNKNLFYFTFFVSIAEYIICSVLIVYICTQFAYRKERDTVSLV